MRQMNILIISIVVIIFACIALFFIYGNGIIGSTYSNNNISFSYPHEYAVFDLNNQSTSNSFIKVKIGNLYLRVGNNSSNEGNFTLCTVSEPPIIEYFFSYGNRTFSETQIIDNETSLNGCINSVKSKLREDNYTIYNETELTINGLNAHQIIYNDPNADRSIIVIYENPSKTKFYAIQGVYHGYENKINEIINSFKITG